MKLDLSLATGPGSRTYGGGHKERTIPPRVESCLKQLLGIEPLTNRVPGGPRFTHPELTDIKLGQCWQPQQGPPHHPGATQRGLPMPLVAPQEEILSMSVPGLGPPSSPLPPLTLQFLLPSRMCNAASGFRALARAVPSAQDNYPLCDCLPNSYKYFETQSKRLSCLEWSLSGLPRALGCKLSKHL